MFANAAVSSLGVTQAAVAVGVCSEVRPCFACALEDFAKETASGRKNADSERVFQLFCVLLTQYVNSFGAALLAARGIPMSVLPGRRRTSTSQPIEKYTAGEVAQLLRAFVLFYVLFKVDAPNDIKYAWLVLARQLTDWLVNRGFAPADFSLNFDPCDDDEKINAICGAGLINQAAEDDDSILDAHEERYGEPFYVVSKVVPGKLWFLYCPSPGRCAEFGPVCVPLGVASFIKAGWGLDCKFVKVGARWRIAKVQDVLPI